MNFELLANELILDLFEYLDTNDLFNAFYNLNIRLNELLFIHCQFHAHFNFQSISKTNFDRICREYLSKNLNRIKSIHLSDHDNTPDQINCFLSYHFQIPQFIYLKSLSLSYISSESIITKIIIALHQLNHLTHLKMIQYCVDHDLMNNGWIFDQIWSLKNLNYCYFQRKKYLWNPFFISPIIISHSIKSLYLEGFSYNSQELHSLLLHTTNLENLSIEIEHNYGYQEISTNIYSLKRLKLFVQYTPFITNNLLEYMPNLIDLTIELAYIVIDGYQWEKIINNHLPNLKKFQMKMEFYLRDHDEKEEQINQLLNSFTNQFWIDQHRWFIQCHWYLSNKPLKAYLYTLPYYPKEFSLISDMQFKSTYPNNEIYWSYDNVENLSFTNAICPLIRFHNLKYLRIIRPFDELFWSIIPNFNRLKSLHVKLFNERNSVLQLENLVRKSTCLYSLTLTGEIFSYEMLFNLRNSLSIRRLNLYDFGCFNEEQCEKFIVSPLGIQCEILLITVNNRNNILHLVNRMKNLRALNVRSQDDKWKRDEEELSIDDEIIIWLNDRLPTTCIIKRGYIHNRGCLQLWIR